MKIVSGKTGTSHVTSEQFRQIIEGTVGQGSYILTSGENLEPELASNNMLKIRGGMMSHHGNVSCVELNTYDEVTLTNGSQGVKRIDLIVNRYTRNDETGLEKNEWVVIIGTPDATNPKVPEYIAGNLQNGDLTDDCPVFEVHYDGINVTEVKKLLPVMSNLDLLNGKSIIEFGENDNGSYIKFGDGTLFMWGNAKIKFTFASGDPKFGEFYVSRSYTRNFPVESLTPCSVQAIPYNNSYSLLLLTTSSLNKKDFTVRLIRSGGSDFESIICWQAIGRWK